MSIFVNREDEINTLERVVKGGGRVWITGLRGYGKTALVKRLVERLNLDGFSSIYIDCGSIFSSSDLLLELKGQLEELGLIDELTSKELDVMISTLGTKEALEVFFDYASKGGVKLVVFDEISTLIQRFSLMKPYRGFGGSSSLGQHLKSILNKFLDISVIFVDTSINALYELFMDYTSPLFKEFTYRMDLGPLSIEDSVALAGSLLKERGISIREEAIYMIAQYSAGVPTYIRMLIDIVKPNTTEADLEKTIFESLEEGILNDYFSSLFEKFSTAEQEVLLLISRNFRRYSEISSRAINAARALELLVKKGIIYKLKVSKKEVYYGIKDRLFGAWLARVNFPRLKNLSREKIKMFYLGFEAVVREMLRTLKKEVRVRDAFGRELKLEPFKEVKKYMGSLGEIDIIAVGETYTLVGEVYAGGKFPKRKIDQLINNIVVAEKLGYNNIIGLAISLSDYPDEVLDYARKKIEAENIYLLDIKALKEISKYTEFKI